MTIQFNSLDTYHESGFKAGKAMRQQDIARHDNERRWFREALYLESGEHKAAAEAAYKAGYKAGYGEIKPLYFK
jgi:hypothetical protein